jgi:hypothetical protein
LERCKICSSVPSRAQKYTKDKLDAENSTLIEPQLILTLPALPGPSHNGGILEFDDKEKEKLCTLLRNKKWNPYCLRHSSISYDSDYLPEDALRKVVRKSGNILKPFYVR